jgi:hypothetical protein
MKITYLIAPDPALKRLVEATPSGMAHWSRAICRASGRTMKT